MATVPTPLLEVDDELLRVLDPEYTYYDRPPGLDYEVPYVRQLRIDTVEISLETTGRWEIVTVVQLEIVVDSLIERVTALAARVIDTLDAATWAFTGFGISRNFGSGLGKDTFQGLREEDLDRVILDYTFIVDYLC